jgi:DNA-directed RNA polymerase I and III subunit RPAC1
MQSTERVILREFELLNCSTEPDFFGGPDKVGREGEHIVKLFKSRLRVEIVRKENFDLEFDLVGVDPSLANAIRRILLSDVPSMAFEKIHIFNNTSVIQVTKSN